MFKSFELVHSYVGQLSSTRQLIPTSKKISRQLPKFVFPTHPVSSRHWSAITVVLLVVIAYSCILRQKMLNV